MRLAAAVLAVLALSGCSLFGDRAENLRFDTLVQNDTFLQPTTVRPQPVVVLQSQAAEDAYRQESSAPPFPTAVDYTRETVLGVTAPVPVAGSTVTITRITHRGSEVRIEAASTGPLRVQPGSVAAAVPVHFVTVPVIRDRIGRTAGAFSEQQP